MAKKKEPTYVIHKAYKRIEQLIKEYGKVRVIFEGYYHTLDGFALSNSMRRRVLHKNGDARVAYKSEYHTKYSGYTESCFLSNRKEKTLKQTLKTMRNHDLINNIVPMRIEYGWFFNKGEDFDIDFVRVK